MPLSDNRVIGLLNRYFVPVYTSNEDYRDGGSASEAEKVELVRIHQEGYAKKLSVGSVHAFVLAPDGRVLDSLHVAEAFKVDRLVGMLERTVEKLRTAGGETVVRPAPQSAPKKTPGALQLHLVARYLERKGDSYALIEDAGGNWSAFPGEDWIELPPAEARKLLPPAGARVGTSWELEPAAVTPILSRCYPPTENNDLSKNRFEQKSLKAMVVSLAGGKGRARIEGALRMGHPFYHTKDDKLITANFAGFMDFDVPVGKVHSFRLVTTEATYGAPGESSQPFGVVVRSMP